MKVTSGDMRYGALWTREESILAFELYCRIPFQKTKANNPAVKRLAALLGRTPASVARKLGNFGAFDPTLKNRNISGLTHTSKLDKEIWDEFHTDWNGLVWEATQLRSQLGKERDKETIYRPPDGPSEAVRLTRQRVHQSFFRDVILSSYEATCCVTGITLPDCLIASHIVPWSMAENLRTDPTNGLCLSATFDRLFDAGLMTVTTDLNVCFSTRLLKSTQPPVRDLICIYHNRPIKRPHRFLPAEPHLNWHKEHRFIK
jgi:putative restriction endonuclease